MKQKKLKITTSVLTFVVAFNFLIFYAIVHAEGDTSEKSLIAYYPFNGNANDESTNERNGTISGATLVSDRFGNENSAYYFDGVDDSIIIGSHPLSYKCISVSVWIKTTKGKNNWRIIDWNSSSGGANEGGFDVGIGGNAMGDPSNVCYVSFRDDKWVGNGDYPRLNSTSNLADGEWHNIIFVYDGNAYLYIDGILEDEMERNSALTNVNQHLFIGYYPQSYPYFDGSIDDIKIYNYGLTQEEVIEVWNQENTNSNNCLILDSDKDGVINQLDKCPNTPVDSWVNKEGCRGDLLYTKQDMEKIVSHILNWGDTNEDGKINLSEAINALIITSGVTR